MHNFSNSEKKFWRKNPFQVNLSTLNEYGSPIRVGPTKNCKKQMVVHKENKRRLDSYACPDQSNRNSTNQQLFLQNILKMANLLENAHCVCRVSIIFTCKKYFKNGEFMGKRTVCMQSLTFFCQKGSIFYSIF